MGALDSLKEKYGDDWNQLVDRFESSGFGDKVKSWIGTGENDPITPDEVKQGIGQEEIDRMARESGKTSDEIADELSRELPRAIDAATPTGQIPTSVGRPSV